MKRLSQTKQFAKDVKRMRKRGKDIEKLKAVVTHLASEQALEPRYRDHALAGEWKNCRDCHLEPDWILIYWMNAHISSIWMNGTWRSRIVASGRR